MKEIIINEIIELMGNITIDKLIIVKSFINGINALPEEKKIS